MKKPTASNTLYTATTVKGKGCQAKQVALTVKQLKLINGFGGCNSMLPLLKNDWPFVMSAVDKIESIIGHSVKIKNEVQIYWWYSAKKTITFSKGAGGGGGGTEKRNPFDSIGGKANEIICYYNPDIQFKTKPDEWAIDKINATAIACARFIEWYNKNVKK